ncbi:MAG: hypothetical protein QG670_1048 [Thermoproteota archaeon]|nr:hypothetical protein [Thermoproteota archaeon]
MNALLLVEPILKRRSIRSYKPDPIQEEVLNNILEAGRLAPTAGNRQPWHFIVVTDQRLKQELSQGKWNTFIKDSAFTIVGCAYMGSEYAQRWSTVDVSIALENMVLTAAAQGVGSCWVGDFKEEEVKRLFGIPEDHKVVCLVAFGYPTEIPSPHGKKDLREIIGYNKF